MDRPVEVEKVVEKIVEKVVHIDKGVYMDKTDKKNGAEKMAADNNGKVSGNDGVQMNRELSLEQENNRLR